MKKPIPKVEFEFLSTDVEPDIWQVHRVDLREGIDRCYRLVMELVTTEVDQDLDALLGSSATLFMRRGAAEQPTSGIITEIDLLGSNADNEVIRIVIEPALALLKQSRSCRMFQNLSVAKVVEGVLQESLKPYDRTFTTKVAARGQGEREYCVQYQESDFDFVVRLLQEEGISYVFDHESDPQKETLVLFDQNEQLAPAMNMDENLVYPMVAQDGHLADVESLSSFRTRGRLVTTSAVRSDWDWEEVAARNSHKDVDDARSRARKVHLALARRYAEDDLEQRVMDVVESHQVNAKVARASSNATTLRPGKKIEVQGSPRAAGDGEYIVTGQHHRARCPEVLRSAGKENGVYDGPRYETDLELIPAQVPLRPLASTSKPRIPGPQTARVCGPGGTYDPSSEGEEIHTDAHGRIKVKFHWQLESSPGNPDSISSCWVRVSQTWAGPGWGTQFIPRVGMEVVVEFLDGNPDRPLVTGCVYNGEHGYPFALPDEKTRSGLKTSSSIDAEGYNEISFEDQAGSEEVRIHGQKDMNTTVLNDRKDDVKNNSTIAIGANETHTVGGNRSQTVSGNKTTTVEKDNALTIKGTDTQKVTGVRDVEVESDQKEVIGGNLDENVVLSKTESIGGDYIQDIIGAGGSGVALTQTVNGPSRQTFFGDRTIETTGLLSSDTTGEVKRKASGDFSLTSGATLNTHSTKNTNMVVGEQLNVQVGDHAFTTRGASVVGAAKDIEVNGGTKLTVTVANEVVVNCGAASVTLKSDGSVSVNGQKVGFESGATLNLAAAKISIN